MHGASPKDARSLNLPDFCAARAVLAVARQDTGVNFWLDLARTSLFLLWCGLGGAAALCLLRARLARMPLASASALALGSLVGVIALVSLGVLWLGSSAVLGPRATNLLLPVAPQRFFAASLGIGAIIGALALRYFYVSGEWRRNVELQARARVRALQARIRPHFLFNSMNTIAALTRSDPARAEEAVQDLADLFRANLSEQRSSITLKEELEVARIYQRIEQLRLGERLRVEIDVDAVPLDAPVPALLLQPLVENAVLHGIQPLAEGGTVRVIGRADADHVVIEIHNPRPRVPQPYTRGNRTALENIRQRIRYQFGDRGKLEVVEGEGYYAVTVLMPRP